MVTVGKDVRLLESNNPEWQFAVLAAFIINKFTEDGEFKLDFKEFMAFMDEGHSFERIDHDGYSLYKVK
jgi:hypothetical protein